MRLEMSEEDFLAHYGTLRKSGRFPWGSGEDQNTRNKMFLDYVDEMRSKGLSDTDIAVGLGVDESGRRLMSTTALRQLRTIALNQQKQDQINMAVRLKDKGLSNGAIAERMGLPNESSVRLLLDTSRKDRNEVLNTTASVLRDEVAKSKYIDVGSGVENHIGVSQTKLSAAVALLEEEGYNKYYVNVEQLGTGKNTKYKVLTPPGTTYSEVYKNRFEIKQVSQVTGDGGRTYVPINPPTSISSKRIAIKYKEDGGDKADGVIYVRPGVEDTTLGKSRYAQVRIAVDGTHFLKGMAMYKDDLPPGVDLEFNTNKSNTGNKIDAMKAMEKKADGSIDLENPFAASISRQHGVMNIINEEGDWSNWSKTLSSQMLSKQTPRLAKAQLALMKEQKKNELDEILALTNPVVRKKLLLTFADGADRAAVHLKAAGLPRNSNHVILPINSLSETQVYAPKYNNGEVVVLIRHPHGGKFEIPELTVNNRNREAIKALGTNPRDAIGINSKVAARLSGADFDGDHVLVIPNNNGQISTARALEGLKNFDPQREYPAYPGMPKITEQNKQIQMGLVSNLITDMTIRGANDSEIVRAVRHSMVVIDSEKHNLNYKLSAEKNGIAQLKAKYQLHDGGKLGAATLISRASSEQRVPMRVERPAKNGGPIDPKTGKKVWEYTGETYVKTTTSKKGVVKTKIVPKTVKSTQLAEADDAHSLSSGMPIEKIYADHSNSLKALANQARKEYVSTKNIPYSESAKAAYSKEVADLNASLNLATRNRPRERQAQIVANAAVHMKRQANPNMTNDAIKKLKSKELIKARARMEASKPKIEITDKQWEAIQAGAISTHKLAQILDNADLDRVKELATPRSRLSMTTTKLNTAKYMLESGYTQAEVAKHLGVSVTTLQTSLDGG